MDIGKLLWEMQMFAHTSGDNLNMVALTQLGVSRWEEIGELNGFSATDLSLVVTNDIMERIKDGLG